MSTLNKFGRIPIADAKGFPTPAFQVWLDGLLQRTGGAEQSSLALESVNFINVPVTAHSTDLPVVDVISGSSSDLSNVGVFAGHDTHLETV